MHWKEKTISIFVITCIGVLSCIAVLIAVPLLAQDTEVGYAPPEFKVDSPGKAAIEPVIISGFPVTAGGKEAKYFVVVLIVRGPEGWSGSLTQEKVFITDSSGKKVPAEYLGFGGGGSLSFGPNSGPPYRLGFGKTGIVVGADRNAVTLKPTFTFKMGSDPVNYKNVAFPAQFWFLFPFTESRSSIADIQIDTVHLTNSGIRPR